MNVQRLCMQGADATEVFTSDPQALESETQTGCYDWTPGKRQKACASPLNSVHNTTRTRPLFNY